MTSQNFLSLAFMIHESESAKPAVCGVTPGPEPSMVDKQVYRGTFYSQPIHHMQHRKFMHENFECAFSLVG